MTEPYRQFLKVANHCEMRRILSGIAGQADLQWYDDAALTVALRWYRTAQQHRRSVEETKSIPRLWRSTISRCYYAVYNASKSVRYLVTGRVGLDASDHKQVGDLPGDFPDRDRWSNFAVELRRDRNVADYEGWTAARQSLTYPPAMAVTLTSQFLRVTRQYLRQRGVSL